MGRRNGSAPVRLRPEGWEYRCGSCVRKGGTTAWWPLTTEYWLPNAGMLRCRACWHDKFRRDAVSRRLRDPEFARARDRARYAANRRVLLIKRSEYHSRNREARNRKARERYARRRNEVRGS